MNNIFPSTNYVRILRCRIVFTSITLLSLYLLLTSAIDAHAARNKFPAPKWLEKVTVSEHMIINGLPSSVQYFEAYKGLDDLLDYYRKQWEKCDTKKVCYKEVKVQPWHIISKLDGRYLFTVQVQKNGPFSIKGYLAVADLKEASKKSTAQIDVPKMQGSRVINNSTTIDPGKHGRTLMLVNNFSVASNSDFYRNYYEDRGWSKLVDMEQERAQVFTFKKHNKESRLVINHIGDATQIVMNLVERN